MGMQTRKLLFEIKQMWEGEMDVNPSVNPMEVCARGSLEPDRTEDVEGLSGFRNSER